MSSSGPRPRLQFSLRWMLITVTVMAVLLGLATLVGGAFVGALAMAICVLYPTPLVIAAFFSRGDQRDFAIGALIPWVAMWSQGFPWNGSIRSLSWFLLWLLFWGLVCGYVALRTHRWIDAAGRSDGA